MAATLGYDSFIDLGYKRMNRIDYGRADVERFREEVRRHVVPLAEELMARQRADLGLERLMAWDEEVPDPLGAPEPRGDHDWMVGRAQEMFDAMTDELGSFFRRMQDGGFLDLKARPREGRRRLLHRLSDLRHALRLRELQRHQGRRRGPDPRDRARLPELPEPGPLADGLHVAHPGVLRDPLDEPGVPDLAPHGALLRSGRRPLPARPPDREPGLPALRHGGRPLPARGLRPARADPRRAPRDLARPGAHLSALARLGRSGLPPPAAAAGRPSATST